MMRYYEVQAKCGHVGGRGYYILMPFYAIAENGRAAAANVRNRPRVKHDRKDAIVSVREITPDEYRCGLAANDAEPYLQCTNVQEQRRRCPDLYFRVVREEADEDEPERRPNLKKSRRFRDPYEGICWNKFIYECA